MAGASSIGLHGLAGNQQVSQEQLGKTTAEAKTLSPTVAWAGGEGRTQGYLGLMQSDFLGTSLNRLIINDSMYLYNIFRVFLFLDYKGNIHPQYQNIATFKM